MAKVESFNLDHTRVHAPYVRLGGKHFTAHGDVISKFDLRFTQPNKEFMGTGAIHTLEHLMAGMLRDHLNDVVDLSPMGCRTGFYLTLLGDVAPETVLQAFSKTLESIKNFDGTIPGVSELECGNHKDHSLVGAREWAEKVLARGLRVQETIYIEAK